MIAQGTEETAVGARLIGPAVTSEIVRIMCLKRRSVPQPACGVSTAVSRNTCFTRVALPTIDVVKMYPDCVSFEGFPVYPKLLLCAATRPTDSACIESCCSPRNTTHPDLTYFLDMKSCHPLPD
ncbi:unnamed protein product [Ectocarpus sp. 8 AP-2014]